MTWLFNIVCIVLCRLYVFLQNKRRGDIKRQRRPPVGTYFFPSNFVIIVVRSALLMKLVNFLRFRLYPRPIYLSLYDVHVLSMIFVFFPYETQSPILNLLWIDRSWSGLSNAGEISEEKKWEAMSILWKTRKNRA